MSGARKGRKSPIPGLPPEAVHYHTVLESAVKLGQSPLQVALMMAVPRAISDLVARGGPAEEDWQFLPEFADLLAEKGDDLLYRGKKDGDSAAMFAKLVRAISIMAFVPGGIHICDQHYWAMVKKEPPS